MSTPSCSSSSVLAKDGKVSAGALSASGGDEAGVVFADVLRHLRTSRRVALAPPLLSEMPLSPYPLWSRVVHSVMKIGSTREREKRTGEVVQRKMVKELQRYHEDARVREERERRQQRESRARLGSKLHLLAERYWNRRGEAFQQVMGLEFQTVKQFCDRQRQEALLVETEELTRALLERMQRRQAISAETVEGDAWVGADSNEEKEGKKGAPASSAAPSLPIEARLTLLNTLKGERPLRSYQRSALQWMIHLYDSQLNGILADEMGLGKTVQTIALLCYFAQYRNDWGPHLIVVPTTVVLNWKEELQRWAPGLKVITYIGSTKERLQFRKGWMKEDTFHICVTSYNVVVNDRAVFRRRPWGFLVLDEAHQIKNFMSKKWQSLFDLQVDYRLLLTGTPLQNSVMELWSLFHFLLPSASAFRSNEEFKEWFSNPLEDMVSGRAALNESIIRRLQSLLRPFMLRRLKREVESQLPTKTEKVVLCKLSRRQRALYDDYMQLSDTRRRIQKGGVFSVLLALRKVCDHPDLFEERPTISPLVLDSSSSIAVPFPRLSFVQSNSFRYRFPGSFKSFGVEVVDLHEDVAEKKNEEEGEEEGEGEADAAVFDWLPCRWLLLSFHYTSCPSLADPERHGVKHFREIPQEKSESPSPCFTPFPASSLLSQELQWAVHRSSNDVLRYRIARAREQTRQIQQQRYVAARSQVVVVSFPHAWLQTPIACSMHVMNQPWWESYQDLCPSVGQRVEALLPLLEMVGVFVPPAHTRYRPRITCALPVYRIAPFMCTNAMCAPLIGWATRTLEQRWLRDRAPRADVFTGANFLRELWPLHIRRCFSFPDKNLLIHDCGKLQYLKTALKQLRAEGHRVLIFTQFVKMLHILERFLARIGVAYLRLDGSTKAEQRQFNVQRFNHDERITVMILSTRSGGIGLNLTGADTVIFYDSDWNPTMDLQAQDRCHRIGQTRPVTIYRLVSAHTVEESILEKARERKKLNNVVIRGGKFNAIAGVVDERSGDAEQEDGESGEQAAAAAAALLFMRTDLRAFFHDRDEDEEVVEDTNPAHLLEAMKSAEDDEDRVALEQLEDELVQRERDDALDAEEGGGGSLHGGEGGVGGLFGAAYTGWEDPAGEEKVDYAPPLKLYKEEPLLEEAVRRRQRQLLLKSRSPLDLELTRHYGLYRPGEARRRYERMCEEYQRRIDVDEDVEMPRFRPRLL